MQTCSPVEHLQGVFASVAVAPGAGLEDDLVHQKMHLFFNMVFGTLLGGKMCQNGIQNGGQNRGKSEKNRVRDGSAKKDAKKCENGCFQIVLGETGTAAATLPSTLQGCWKKLQKIFKNTSQIDENH